MISCNILLLLGSGFDVRMLNLNFDPQLCKRLTSTAEIRIIDWLLRNSVYKMMSSV